MGSNMTTSAVDITSGVTDAPAEAPVPQVRIRPNGAWSIFDLRELWQFRDLLRSLASRDVKLRYRQTALGICWVLFQPLLAAGILTAVFKGITKLPSDNLPYFMFVYAGMLIWNAFNSTLTKAANSLVGNTQLVSKVYFPRLILPLSTALSTMLDFLIALALLAVMMAVYHVRPGWAILTLPFLIALTVMFAMGLGLIAAALTVSYRDVQYILPILLPFVLYASPIGYTINVVPQHLKMFFHANPLTGLLEACRWALFAQAGGPSLRTFTYSALMAVLVFVIGASVFVRMERKFADVI
jgi:lipopolysaccharide transport system permease protein